MSAVSGPNFNRVDGHSGVSHIQRVDVSKSNVSKFAELLKDKIESADVKFSAHAKERLECRNIELNRNDILRLNDAVEKAGAKGSKEALILLNNLAMIVSVKNRMVITAVENSDLKENIFTNIDSAVILNG